MLTNFASFSLPGSHGEKECSHGGRQYSQGQTVSLLMFSLSPRLHTLSPQLPGRASEVKNNQFAIHKNVLPLNFFN